MITINQYTYPYKIIILSKLSDRDKRCLLVRHIGLWHRGNSQCLSRLNAKFYHPEAVMYVYFPLRIKKVIKKVLINRKSHSNFAPMAMSNFVLFIT